MRTTKLAILALVSVIALLLAGCGSSRDSGGDQTAPGTTLADAQTLGITNCLTCHNSATTVTAGWLNSRHGNDLLAAEKEILNAEGAHVDDTVDEGRPGYSGLPAICFTCHDQLGDGRLIDNALFGENERPIISCESCHGGGQFHNGIAAGIPFPTPGPEQCGQCHGVNEELFHDDVPRNISDSHFDDPTTVAVVEGFVVKITEQTGCVDCHYSAHDFDLTINNQWAESAHGGHIKQVKDAVVGTLADVKAAGVTAEAFIHDSATGGWDNTAENGDCQRCHTATGAANFLNEPAAYDPALNDFSHLAGWTAATGSGQTELIYCQACHSDSQATLRDPGSIPFPSGASQSLADGSNVCMACHQGRESGVTVADATLTGTETGLSFINRHYFAAAAIMFGTDVTAGYEYAGKIYKGATAWPAAHTGNGLDTCAGCHMREGDANHTFEPDIARCQNCHVDSGTVFPGSLTLFSNLGLPFGATDVDYDGDTIGESFQGEIDGLEAVLLAQIKAYAAANSLPAILYDAGNFPYFVVDADGDGAVGPGEGGFGGRYTDFDAKLLRAAYNYHSNQDPCSDIHNYKYVIQTIIDSIEDLGGSIVGFTRP